MALRSRGERLFETFNIIVLSLVSIAVLVPFWLLLVDSFSTPESVYLRQFRAQFMPVSWSITAYQTVLQKSAIGTAYANTLFRTVIGTLLNTLVTIAAAYAISKRRLPFIRLFTFMIVFTLFFNGGLIPRFLLVRSVGLLDSRWALIWPVLVQAYTLLIARNFMFSIPDSLEESAYIDGANEITILGFIVLPLSKPIIATVALWAAVMHWNAWFDAMIYVTDTSKVVLQLLLRRVLLESQIMSMTDVDLETDAAVTEETVKAALIFISIGPIVILYPFAQKYFIRGVLIGSVKG